MPAFPGGLISEAIEYNSPTKLSIDIAQDTSPANCQFKVNNYSLALWMYCHIYKFIPNWFKCCEKVGTPISAVKTFKIYQI